MQIMLLWSAAIGWRRFYQGVMVRQGRTRLVSYGTCIRLAVVVGTALVLLHDARLPGVRLAAMALMAGVITESLVTTVLAWPIVRATCPSRTRHRTFPR